MSTALLNPLIDSAPTKRLEVLPTTNPGVGYVTLISIYPGLLFRRVRHNGMTDYRILPAERGSYRGLRVFDTQEWLNRPDPTDGKPQWIPAPIPCMVVAEALLKIWARSSLGNKSGFAPGVMIIKGDEPTQEDLNYLRRTQDNLFNWYINDANGKHMKGEHTEINEVHRMAAKEMLDSGAEKLPWYKEFTYKPVKECMACGKNIEVKALVCTECHTNLIDWYLKYNLDPNLDLAIKDFMSKMNLGAPIKKGKES